LDSRLLGRQLRAKKEHEAGKESKVFHKTEI